MTLVRPNSAIVLLAALLALAGCTPTPDRRGDAQGLIAEGRYEEAVALVAPGPREVGSAPEAIALRTRIGEIVADRLLLEARRAALENRLDDAERAYRRLLALAPTHPVARAEIERLQQRRLLDAALARAEDLFRGGQFAEAERAVRDVLVLAPTHRRALDLGRQIAEQQRKAGPAATVPGPEFGRRVSLEFKDVTLRSVFDVIWHSTGINFILDREVKTDEKVSIFVNDTTAEEAIDSLLMTQQLARKLINSKTLFVFPRTPQKLADYQDVMVRSFFLGHADAKQMQGLLKSALKIREVFLDEKRNVLVVRDTPEQIGHAERMILAHDQPEPEVMLALDVIEVRRARLKDLGLALPGQLTLGVPTTLSLAGLGNLSTSGISASLSGPAGANVLAALNMQLTESDANTLANPRIRVRNREKAKFHIGDRLPVVTTTSSSTSSFVGETVTYLDVGLKMEVEPQVLLEGHVVVKLNLEVSSATQSKVNAKFYDVGTRNTSTVLTIRDGETQVLAGLIRDDERQSASRVPGLGELPLLGRLFSSERKEQDKTEIILAITPTVLANIARPTADLAAYGVGSEGAGGAIPARQETAVRRAAAAPPATAATPAAAPSAAASASTATTQPKPAATGVLPLIEFEAPPGVGAPPVPR